MRILQYYLSASIHQYPCIHGTPGCTSLAATSRSSRLCMNMGDRLRAIEDARMTSEAKQGFVLL
eukprot:3256469-Prymnesium_polylepis.1